MSPASKKGWDQPLTETLRTRGGRELKTLRDAAAMILDGLPELRRCAPPWEYAAELLLRAAESGKDADRREATEQVARALGCEGLLAREPVAEGRRR